MKKISIFLILFILFYSFNFTVAADETAGGSGFAQINFDDRQHDLSIDGAIGGFDASDGFTLYFSNVVENLDAISSECYVVFSGSIRFNITNVSDPNRTFDFTTVYPSSWLANRKADGTYERTNDISQFYSTRYGTLDYQGSSISLLTQMSLTEDGFILSYVYAQSSSSRYRDNTIKFNCPIISDASVRTSNFKQFTIAVPSSAVEDSINSLNQATVSGLGGVQSAVNALSTLTQSNFASTEQLLNSLDAAISDLKGSVSDSVYNALDEWHQHELDFVQSDLNPLVQGVVDDINDLYDYDTFYGAFQSIVNMVTGGSTRAAATTRLRIPAGVVTVGGHTYRFWEETYVDFGPVFENEMIQLLLIPFRFIVAYGFLKYCLYWINKLINAITLNIKAGAG